MARPYFEDDWNCTESMCEQQRDARYYFLCKKMMIREEPIIPPPLLRGDDLTSGMEPVPAVGDILSAVRRGKWQDR